MKVIFEQQNPPTQLDNEDYCQKICDWLHKLSGCGRVFHNEKTFIATSLFSNWGIDRALSLFLLLTDSNCYLNNHNRLEIRPTMGETKRWKSAWEKIKCIDPDSDITIKITQVLEN